MNRTANQVRPRRPSRRFIISLVTIVCNVGFPGSDAFAQRDDSDLPDAGFGCENATTNTQRILCQNDYLLYQDAQLHRMYLDGLEVVSDNGEFGSAFNSRYERLYEHCAAPSATTVSPAQERTTTNCLEQELEALRRWLSRHVPETLHPIRPLQVESDTAMPRACAVFNLGLTTDVDQLQAYVEVLPSEGTAVSVQHNRLCVDGLEYGREYSITIRSGLASGDSRLKEDLHYKELQVPDRAARLQLTDPGYVLGSNRDNGIPFSAVNVVSARLRLYRVTDENTIKAFGNAVPAGGSMGLVESRLLSTLDDVVWRGEMSIESQLNVQVQKSVPVYEMLAQPEPGIYVLAIDGIDREGNSTGFSAQWFNVSNLALTAYFGETLIGRVSRLDNFDVIEGVEVELRARNNTVLGSARTDARGLVSFPAGLLRAEDENTPVALYARDDQGDFTIVSLTKTPLSFHGDGGYASSVPADTNAWITTSRGVFRPGENVPLTILVRNAEHRAVDDLPVVLKVYRPDRQVVETRTLLPQGDGGYYTTVSLPANAATGYWRFEVSVGDDVLASQSTLVEDFRPPDTRLSLEAPETLESGATLQATVLTEYRYGAPAGDVPGRALLTVNRLNSMAHEGKTYYFGHADQLETPDLPPAESTFVTDGQGRAELALTAAEVGDHPFPAVYLLTVGADSADGNVLVESRSIKVSNDQVYHGIHMTGESADSWRFELAAFNWASEIQAADYRWEITEVEDDYLWYQRNGDWHWEAVQYNGDKVAEGRASSREGAVAGVGATLPAWGRYRLDVYDSEDRLVANQVFHHGRYRSAWYTDQERSPDRVDVKILDLQADQVVLDIAAPFDGRVTVALADQHEVISIHTESVVRQNSRLTLPLPDPGARLGLYALVTAYQQADNLRTFAPARATGRVWIPFDHSDRLLTPSMSIGADETSALLPGSEVDISIAVDPGRQARAVLMAVDSGTLQLVRFKTPDPAGHFLAQPRQMVNAYDIFGRLIDAAGFSAAALRSGGDADLREEAALGASAPELPNLPKKNRKIAAWNSGIVTLANGQGSIKMQVPDFDGELTFFLLTWNQDRVGSLSATRIVRRPFIADLELPRFLAPGDKTWLGVRMQNLEAPAGRYDCSLSIDGAGLAVGGMASVNGTLAPGQQQRGTLALDASTTMLSDNQLALVTTGPDTGFERHWNLSVRPAARPQQFTETHELQPGQQFVPDDQRKSLFFPSTGKLIVRASPFPSLNLSASLAELLGYPYGCAEQTSSRGFAHLYHQALAGLPVSASADDEHPVNIALKRLINLRQRDGYFSAWQGYHQGSAWSTLHVIDFMISAAQTGYPVSEEVMAQNIGFLKNHVNQQRDVRSQQGFFRAQAYYLLARAGEIDVSALKRIAAVRKFHLDARGLAYLGAALGIAGVPEQAKEMFSMIPQAPSYNKSASLHFNHLYRFALTLRLKMESGVFDPQSLQADVSRLSRRLQTGQAGYRSTFDHAEIIRTANALLAWQATLDGQLRIGDETLMLSKPVVREFPIDALINGAAGVPDIASLAQYPVFVDVTWSGNTIEAPPAEGRRMSLQRELFDIDGNVLDPAAVKRHDRVVVVISGEIFSRGDHELLLEDYLPGGFVAENSRLGESEISSVDWLRTHLKHRVNLKFREVRDDRVVMAFDKSPSYQTSKGRWRGNQFQVAYLMRAVNPGEYFYGGSFAESMYQPDVRARTASTTLTIARDH